jgi:uncharacterized membrane protein
LSTIRLRPQWLLAAITAASMLLYASVSVLRWWHFDLDSFDLPIYHQVVWELSRLHAPAVSVLGEENYFGDHFSPILAVFAPLYWAAPSPVVLLVGQTVLIAASIPAVYLYARRRVSERAALILCVAYAQSWGVWAAVDSAVHEVAFAVPLLAWAICFADRRQWRPTYACLAGLILVKEDFGLVVAAFGLLLALRGERRRGVLVAAAGLTAAAVINELVMPALNPSGWSPRDAALYREYGSSVGAAALHLATHPGDLLSSLVDDDQKLRLVALLLGAFAALPLLSSLSLVAVPLVAERLLANDPNLWGPSYQYSLVPMVVLVMAAADGAAMLTRLSRGRRLVPEALVICAAAIALVSAAVFPLSRLAHPGYWKSSQSDETARAAVRVVPGRVSVAGDWATLSHLGPRRDMFLASQVSTRSPRYVIARRSAPGLARKAPYRLVVRFDDVRVYRRASGTNLGT